MAVELEDYADSLAREITPAGGTTTLNSRQLGAYLADAFWEARLDGFLKGYAADEDAVVDPITPDGAVDPTGKDIGREQIALLVVYAGVKILRNQVLNTQTQFRAKAGPVEFEQQSSATMLAEMLKQLAATKARLQEQADDDADLGKVYGFDAYSTRVYEGSSYYGAAGLVG